MELRHLRDLIVLAETGSFHRAARKLGMRQPALSQSIRLLESDIGIELVSRSSSGSHLTRAGDAFLDEARHILAALDSAVIAARIVAGEGANIFRLGITADAATGFTMRALQIFFKESGCKIIVHDALPSRLLTMLDDGQLDLALLPFSRSRISVDIEPLWLENIYIALSIDHHLAAQDAVNIHSLVDELIVVGQEGGIVDLLFDACRALGIGLKNIIKLLHYEARLALVGAGGGVAMQPSSNQHFLSETRIVMRPLVPPITITIAAALPALGMTSSARQFVEIIRCLNK